MAAVKALQQWCRIQCEGYRDVSITNMTTSFRDGLAFCALIHKHRPDLIKFDSLKKEDVYDNNKLAFRIAEEELGIPALLDAEDMVALKVPDRLSILTYVSQYYNYFHGRSPIGGMAGIKRPAEGTTNEPCGKKNQMVTAKVFPSSRPARENSPPPSANITRPSPSPKQTRNATQHVLVEKPQSTGTLSNKCVSCNNHVHLVQRHLVDGKLYHRSCAKSTSHTTSLLRDLPTNTPVSKFTPLPDSTKNTVPPNQTSSRLGPTWLKEKPSSSSFATTFSSSTTCRPASGVSSAAIRSQTPSDSTSMASQTSSERTFTTSTTTNTSAPSTSNTAASILESRRKFFQSDCNANSKGKKTTAVIVDVNKGSTLSGGVQEPTVGQTVTVAVNVAGAGRKETNLDKGGDKAACVGGKASLKQEASEGKTSKASAAAFISKKLTEENNNNNKLSWVKNTDKLPEIETPKREMENNRARIRLRVDPSLLGDLNSPDATSSASSSANRSALSTSTSDRKPGSASPNNSASENESPADWRSRLKPVAKSGGSTQLTKPWTNGAGKSQTSELSVGPSSSSSSIPSLSVSGSPSASKEIQTGQREQTAYGSKSESKMSKTKPGYIPKEDILKELQEIEDNLNELEKQGVEMEMRLRSSEEEGKDDSLMDELMVEWFNLIRNKQVAMRRESELVYIGRTQDLEEQQPSVEEELRTLIDKPEHIKTEWDKKREQQLMEKLLEIVNDRNSIVEGLDEDRLREEEEDEQLNKMLKNFNIKKDKPKKESPVTKLFRWGSKKEK